MRRGLGQKLLISQLPLAVGDFSFDLLQLFRQTLSFGANINLFLINHKEVESRGTTRTERID